MIDYAYLAATREAREAKELARIPRTCRVCESNLRPERGPRGFPWMACPKWPNGSFMDILLGRRSDVVHDRHEISDYQYELVRASLLGPVR